tara:strand:+ start:247 stop:378 length:132 start_codon:yes stop_codon:yes gene_type:complete
MIKKISIFLFIAILFSSCGKKGDPIYNGENQDSEVFSTEQSIV